MLPKVSIIIPCYNHGQYLVEAIESVELCEDKDLYEIIIINDGSTDPGTIKILQQFSDEGYHVINQKNQGLGAARNNAIKAAKGEYILPLDSDNKIRPDYIYESIKILDEQPNIAVVYGDAEYFGEQSGRRFVGEFNLQKMMIRNYIDACAVFRISVWERTGGYDENMPVMGLEDWDFWLSLSFQNCLFFHINKVMFEYRVRNNSMLRSISKVSHKSIDDYLNNKYNRYLNLNHLTEELLKAAKKDKILALKLLLSVYSPWLIKYLQKKKWIKSTDII